MPGKGSRSRRDVLAPGAEHRERGRDGGPHDRHSNRPREGKVLTLRVEHAEDGHGRQVVGDTVEIDQAEKDPDDGLRDEEPDERADQSADLRVDHTADGSAERTDEGRAEDSPPDRVDRVAWLERHVDDAEPDDGDDCRRRDREQREAYTRRRPDHELERDEDRPPRRHEQRPGDRPVPKLVREEEHSQEEREDDGRKRPAHDEVELVVGREAVVVRR